MSALCIYGANSSLREKKASETLELYDLNLKSPNTLVITTESGKKSIGIDQVRQIKEFLSLSPQKTTHKAVVILEGHLLTTQAQNALLKVLEEPPSYGVILITSKALDQLLPTVVSRCKKIELKTKEVQEGIVGFTEIINLSVGERFLYTEKLIDLEKEDLILTFEAWIQTIRSDFQTQTNYDPKNALEAIMKAKNDIENTNINGKMVLEWLFITLS